MRSAFARPLAGVALAILLSLLTVPSVDAGSLFPPAGTHMVKADWMMAAWAWLGEIWGSNHGTSVPFMSPQATDNSEMTRSVGATGVCIDPSGNVVPCADGLRLQPGRRISYKPWVVALR